MSGTARPKGWTWQRAQSLPKTWWPRDTDALARIARSPRPSETPTHPTARSDAATSSSAGASCAGSAGRGTSGRPASAWPPWPGRRPCAPGGAGGRSTPRRRASRPRRPTRASPLLLARLGGLLGLGLVVGLGRVAGRGGSRRGGWRPGGLRQLGGLGGQGRGDLLGLLGRLGLVGVARGGRGVGLGLLGVGPGLVGGGPGRVGLGELLGVGRGRTRGARRGRVDLGVDLGGRGRLGRGSLGGELAAATCPAEAATASGEGAPGESAAGWGGAGGASAFEKACVRFTRLDSAAIRAGCSGVRTRACAPVGSRAPPPAAPGCPRGRRPPGRAGSGAGAGARRTCR